MVPRPDPPLRVLLYLPGLTVGGTEENVWHLATMLDRSRFEPMVAWSDSWGMLGDRLLRAGVPVHRLPIATHLTAEGIAGIRSLHPDVFHSFNYRDRCSDVVAAQEAGVPAIISTRTNSRHWDPDMRVRPAELIRNRAAHAFVACSQAAAWVCANVERVPYSRITVIPSGVRIPAVRPSRTIRDELAIPSSKLLIGYVASYRELKEHETLVRAFARVRESRPDIHLVCCGDDLDAGTRERILRLSQSLGLQDSVSLLLEREDVQSVYAGLDLYVQASRSEGLSNALLEAMAHGVPVVATSVGGTAEVIADGVTGRLIPPRDPEPMAAAMLELLDSPNLRAALATAGADLVRSVYSVERKVRSYESLYRDTFAAQRRHTVAPARISRRLRVVYHLDVLHYGGLEKKVMNLALGLDRTRFEPIVTWSNEWGALGSRLKEAGIAVPQVPLSGDDLAAPAEILCRLNADVFHSFSCRRSAADARAASQAGIPIIVTNRGNVRHWDQHARRRPWEAERNALTTAISACCTAVAWVCSNVERVPFSRIAVLYNGVAIPDLTRPVRDFRAELGLPRETILLGYVANYRAVKNHDGLLRALAKAVRRNPALHLVCCGGDPFGEGHSLPALVRKLGLSRHVSLLPLQEHLDAVYRALDIYVHASLSEGFSNAVLEAMSFGLPVIATSAGGTGEAVEHGATGYLVPAGDESALIEAILLLSYDPENRRSFGVEGRDRATRKFALTAMIESYSRFYEDLAARQVPAQANALVQPVIQP